MKNMTWKFYNIILAALFSVAALRAQEIAPRIAGLENNTVYMTLLREDAELQIREDSVVNAVTRVRRLLREQPGNREVYAKEILGLEERIFEIRNAKGRLIDRINTIEQEWVLANLDAGVSAQDAGDPGMLSALPDSLKVRSLVDNLYFREHLPAADYEALRRAQRWERTVVEYVNRYFANYGEIASLAEQYAAAQTEQEALDLYEKYNTMQGFNRVLADSLGGVWNYIFDNKSYAYGYLLDKFGQDEVLAREEEHLSEAARQLSELRGHTVSDVVADYFLRKRVVVDYETAIADLLRLDAARDSLRGVAVQLEGVDFRLPKIEVTERFFLDYDSIAFSSVPKYSYQNPIPECRVYANGTIYRILLGTFNTKRAASTFKGAYPICYRIGDDGKWSYFAGGFATRAEADEAQKQMKSKGFLRPEVVVWTDGQYRNLSREPEETLPSYRVEIVGAASLSDAAKEAIAATAGERELSRVGPQMFVVGVFDDKAIADQVAAAVAVAEPALEIKVAEIAAE